ncbi:caspase family protein [Pleurocapsales cyanobacterium LEGE 06147]|nr:caspase family protein [Pleurocapsales cyanobacterium LEGE 06147]
MGIERRTFLQQVGLALLTLGIGETGIKPYLQVLAQPTKRKLALLVGINEYPQDRALSGCVTDVELQKELLIARFGFHPKDILTLTDRQATRENIETAFVEHLSEQAQADDVVVFHYSGYGSQVKIPISSQDEAVQTPYQLVDSLVPTDGILPTKGMPAANDLLAETLFWLGRSLSTNKLTVVLDTSFGKAKQLLRGNLHVRSFSRIAERPNPEELAFRERLKRRIASKSSTKANPGIILLAAGKNQEAAEAQWQGFSAGLFTYALTQYLWQATPASKIQIALQRATETVEHFMGQQQRPSQIGATKPLLTYYLIPSNSTGAEGVVTEVENNSSLTAKLMGLPIKVLDNYGVNSCLTLVFATQSTESSSTFPPVAAIKKDVWLQIRSRDGLTAKAQLVGMLPPTENIEVGQLLQEFIRVLSCDLGLSVALDSNLARIERVDATSAFANIAAVSSVTTAGEHQADCVLAKVKQNSSAMTEINASQTSQETETASASYGLFSAGGALIPNTVGKSNEAVKAAVSRLTPHFNTLLAAKWLELTVNEGSSRLKVEATLESAEKKSSSLLRRATLRSSPTSIELWDKLSAKSSSPSGTVELPILTKGTRARFRLANYGDRPLYVLLLGIDSDGNAITLYVPQAKEIVDNKPKLKDILLSPKQTLIIPEPEDSLNWKIAGSAGIAEIYLIFSIQPFQQTLKALSTKQNLKLVQEQVLNIINPLEVARALLQDLHRASAVPSTITGSNADVYALDVNAWATLNFVYKVA